MCLIIDHLLYIVWPVLLDYAAGYMMTLARTNSMDLCSAIHTTAMNKLITMCLGIETGTFIGGGRKFRLGGGQSSIIRAQNFRATPS